MKTILITNNPMIHNKYSEIYEVDFKPNADQSEILRTARDMIHTGSQLVSHPMAGRLKPHESPYRTVVLNAAAGQSDYDSIMIIEYCIQATEKDLRGAAYIKYDDTVLEDLQYIDMVLLDNVINEMEY